MIGASRSPISYRGSGASGKAECCAVSSSPFPPMLSEPERERTLWRMIWTRVHAVIAEGGVGKSDFSRHRPPRAKNRASVSQGADHDDPIRISDCTPLCLNRRGSARDIEPAKSPRPVEKTAMISQRSAPKKQSPNDDKCLFLRLKRVDRSICPQRRDASAQVAFGVAKLLGTEFHSGGV